MPIGKTLFATTRTVKLYPGTAIVIDGPALIRLENGAANCFGASLVQGTSMVLGQGRRASIETDSNATVRLELGDLASLVQVSGSTIPGSWREASQILQQTGGTAAIVGGVDSGKSSLAAFLANESIIHGLRTNVIDGDVGQADIGPPATVSGSTLDAPVYSLQELKPSSAFFVGDTSPGHAPDKICNGLLKVRSHLPRAEVEVVNTDGWIEGSDAFAYKSNLIERLRPDIVLMLGTVGDASLDRLAGVTGCTVLRLEKSSYARERSREDRKHSRDVGYRRFLGGSRKMELGLARRVLRMFDSQQTVLDFSNEDRLRGILSGLLDIEGMMIGISRLSDINEGKVIVETLVGDVSQVSVIELGSVILSSDYEEIGFYGHV